MLTTYGDAAHKHAVTAAFGNSYNYDANGNQTTRTIGGVTYTFTYDYENHLTAVSGGSISASFVYDADGNRVKGTVNGTTTVYIGGLYEYQGGATTLYYEGNALRRAGYATDNGVFYLLQDQLKSSSALANQNGTINSRNYFYPFGGNRAQGTPGAAFSALTTKRFTGQYHEQGLPGGEGLSYYGARWYDAQLGRFASADSMVPVPGNPQDLNRYTYTRNNPLRYLDPTGHSACFCTMQQDAGDGGGGASQRAGTSIAYGDFWRSITSMRAENAWQQTMQSWNPAYLFPFKWPAIKEPRVPAPTSNDMTAWLAGRIATDSQSGFVKGLQMAYQDGISGSLAVTDAWISLVKTHAVWDFKDDILDANVVKGPNRTVGIGNYDLNYQAVANIYYGFMGPHIGLSKSFLQVGAGIAQCEHGASHCGGNFWNAPRYFGDQAFDGWAIGFGFYLHDRYGSNPGMVTATTLTTALDTYVTNNPVPPGP